MRNMFEKYPDVMNVKEMCSALKIGRNVAYSLLERRKIRSFRIGKSIKIPKKCIEAYIMSAVGEDPDDAS